MAAELEGSNKEEAAKYRTEDEKSVTHLDNLKKAVKGSNPQGFYDNYENPEEGAKLIYTELRGYFERMFQRGDTAESQAPEIFDHIRYLRRHALSPEALIGGEKLFTKIDEYADRIAGETPAHLLRVYRPQVLFSRLSIYLPF